MQINICVDINNEKKSNRIWICNLPVDLGDVDDEEHLHRKPGHLRHIPVLIHHAPDPHRPDHQVLDPRRKTGNIMRALSQSHSLFISS